MVLAQTQSSTMSTTQSVTNKQIKQKPNITSSCIVGIKLLKYLLHINKFKCNCWVAKELWMTTNFTKTLCFNCRALSTLQFTHTFSHAKHIILLLLYNNDACLFLHFPKEKKSIKITEIYYGNITSKYEMHTFNSFDSFLILVNNVDKCELWLLDCVWS